MSEPQVSTAYDDDRLDSGFPVVRKFPLPVNWSERGKPATIKRGKGVANWKTVTSKASPQRLTK